MRVRFRVENGKRKLRAKWDDVQNRPSKLCFPLFVFLIFTPVKLSVETVVEL